MHASDRSVCISTSSSTDLRVNLRGFWAKSRSISCCTACLITELHWIHLRCRYVVAVNGIICVYSFLESWLAVWTFVQGSLVLPETFQVWFDFGHDQVMHEVCTWNGFNMEQSFPRKKKDSQVLNFLARWWSSWVLKLRLATLNFFSLDIYASWSLDKCSDWLIDTQGFAYLLFSASSVGVAMAQLLQTGTVSILSSYDCSDAKAFCNQAKVAISLGFGAFFFLALSSCITGLRVARWWLS